MTSDWWFLAMIGSAASAVGGALGTAASSAMGALGHLAGSAASGIGTAATGALNAVTGGGGAGGAAGAGAAPAAVTAGGGAGGVIPAADVSAAGPASTGAALNTANLPPASGGMTLNQPGVTASPMSTPTPVDSAMGQLFGSSQISRVSAPPAGGEAYGGPPSTAATGPTPTLDSLTNVPGTQPPMQPTPTTFALSPEQAGTGGASGGMPSFLSNLGVDMKNLALNRFGVTNPNMGWGDMLKQGGMSQLAGGPFIGYNPQASLLSNLGGALRQRLLTSLMPGGGGGPPQQQGNQSLAQLGQLPQTIYARNLPVYGSLPGFG